MTDEPEREYQLARPMTGDEIRAQLRAMRSSWYQESEVRIQIGGVAVVYYSPGSIAELRLYSSGAGWTEGIISSESYTAIRFPDIYRPYFATMPDQW